MFRGSKKEFTTQLRQIIFDPDDSDEEKSLTDSSSLEDQITENITEEDCFSPFGKQKTIPKSSPKARKFSRVESYSYQKPVKGASFMFQRSAEKGS